jgi:hypothetical protein
VERHEEEHIDDKTANGKVKTPYPILPPFTLTRQVQRAFKAVEKVQRGAPEVTRPHLLRDRDYSTEPGRGQPPGKILCPDDFTVDHTLYKL